MKLTKTIIFTLVIALVMSLMLAACAGNVVPGDDQTAQPPDIPQACEIYEEQQYPCAPGVTGPGAETAYIPYSALPQTAVIFPLGGGWYYTTASGNRDPNIEGIFAPLFNRFVELFGRQVMTHTQVIIFCDTKAPCPMIMPYVNRYYLRLAQQSTEYWAQMIYQLSHEMMHFAFFSSFPQYTQSDVAILLDTRRSAWNEEIIAEAMSLYMLRYMADNWQRSPLYQLNPRYGSAIRSYLDYIYNDARKYTRPLKSEGAYVCRREFHTRFNRTCYANRADHIMERNHLYNIFVSARAEDIGEIINAYRYFNNDYRYIDYSAWANNARNPDFIRAISVIQPRLQ